MIGEKKAQTEMLGIAIVVILISIGILFIVSNSLRSSGQMSQKQEYSEKQLATNILASMLSTSTNCSNDRISTLLIDCGKDPYSRQCGPEDVMGITTPYTLAGFSNVCVFLNDTIAVLLNSTLQKWNKKYEFKAYSSSAASPELHIVNRIGECLDGTGEGLRYIQKDSYYLPLHPGTMTVELGICS